jgi:hypothetical protein
MQTDPSLSGSLRLHQISDARALEGSEDIGDCFLAELFSVAKLFGICTAASPAGSVAPIESLGALETAQSLPELRAVWITSAKHHEVPETVPQHPLMLYPLGTGAEFKNYIS